MTEKKDLIKLPKTIKPSITKGKLREKNERKLSHQSGNVM